MGKELSFGVAVDIMKKCANDAKEGLKGKSLKSVAASNCFIARPGYREGEICIIHYDAVVVPLINDAVSKMQGEYKDDPDRLNLLRSLLYRETLSRFLRIEKTLATVTVSVVVVSNTNPTRNSGKHKGTPPAILSILDMPGKATHAEVDLIRFKFPSGDVESFSDVLSLKIEGFERSEGVSQGVRDTMRLKYVSVYDQAPLDVSEVCSCIDLNELVGAVSREIWRKEVEMSGITSGLASTLH